ncbi:MAG TPA: LCP family protein [bacterium]|nr:LCP family protein [bacterium]
MKYQDLKGVCKSSKSNKKSKSDENSKVSVYRYVFLALFLLTVGVVSVIVFSDKARALFDPVTLVASINKSDLKETDGRTNVLILGSDRRHNDPKDIPQRADTILVASIGRLDGNVVLISIPRDLWVESSVCGRCKITEVYAYAVNTPSPEEELQKVVETVLGIPIHYYGVVNFDLFENIIDTLGGVTVDVANAFEDYQYPIEGMEDALCGLTPEEADVLMGINLEELPEELKEKLSEQDPQPTKSLVEIFPCRYEHIKFDLGPQEMDGKTALKYVRSRHGTNGEGTDFARSARQQKIIMAIKDKAFSINTLLNPKKIQELYALYKDTIITNIDFSTLQSFYLLSQNVDFSEIRSVVLDDRSAANQGGLLYSPIDTTLYSGKYVLLPRAGNYSQIHAYVQKFLFEE